MTHEGKVMPTINCPNKAVSLLPHNNFLPRYLIVNTMFAIILKKKTDGEELASAGK